MNKQNYIENLKNTISQLNQAKKHLKISYERCQNIGLGGAHNEDQRVLPASLRNF